MRHRTPAALAISAMALIGGLTACSGSDTAGGTPGGGSEPLVYWATNMAPTLADDEAVLTPELKKFTEDTGVEVELEVVPWDALYNRILTAVSSGQGPDVLNIGNTWSASLQATGAFVPFEGEALDAVGGNDRFVASAIAATGSEDAPRTALPLYGQAYGLFYNKTMFAEAGVPEPTDGWTWQQFTDAAKALTKDTNGDGTPEQYGFAMTGGSTANDSHAAFIFGRQYGASLFDAEGNPDFASDAQVQAVKMYVDLMSSGVTLPGSAEYTGDNEADNDIATGKVAMAMQQSAARNAFTALDFADYGVAQIPVVDPLPAGGKATQTLVAGINVSVFQDSDQQEQALELVNFLTSTEEQVILNKAYTTLPVVTAAYDDPAFSDDTAGTFATILGEHAEPMPQVPEEGQMETLVGGAVKTLIAQAATGAPVTEDDVRAQLENAQQQMQAAS